MSSRDREKSERALAQIMGQNLQPGSVIRGEVFEEALQLKRTDQAYGFLISKIRQELYRHGLYLSGEGFSETGCYEILMPADNYWVAKLALARADRDLEGKMTLLAHTNVTGLTELQKRRHENGLREISLKLSAMRRAREFEHRLLHKSPGELEDGERDG